MVERIENQTAITRALDNLKTKIDGNGNGLKGSEVINFTKFAQAEGISKDDIDAYLKSIGLSVEKSDKEIHREDIQEFKDDQSTRTSRSTKNKIINLKNENLEVALKLFKDAKTPEIKAQIMDLVQAMPRSADSVEEYKKQIAEWVKKLEAASKAPETEASAETTTTATTAETSSTEADEASSTKAAPEESEQTPEKAEQQAPPQKFKVPAGWSVSQIAKAFGITREEVLRANVDENGNKAYRTSKKGVEYFLVDQEINIPADAKFNEDSSKTKAADETTPAKGKKDSSKSKEADDTPKSGDSTRPQIEEDPALRAEARKEAEAEAKARDFAKQWNLPYTPKPEYPAGKGPLTPEAIEAEARREKSVDERTEEIYRKKLIDKANAKAKEVAKEKAEAKKEAENEAKARDFAKKWNLPYTPKAEYPVGKGPLTPEAIEAEAKKEKSVDERAEEIYKTKQIKKDMAKRNEAIKKEAEAKKKAEAKAKAEAEARDFAKRWGLPYTEK